MISYGKIQNSYELDEEVYTDKMIPIGELNGRHIVIDAVIQEYLSCGEQRTGRYIFRMGNLVQHRVHVNY